MAKKEIIIIVGAGLSGPLLAIMLRQKGYSVDIYEQRADIRLENMSAGRSINLALSKRGLAPLYKIGLAEQILSTAIPMKGRLIHSLNGDVNLQPYSGRTDNYIYSVSRRDLNVQLINEAERLGIPIHFNHKCRGADLQNGTLAFYDEVNEVDCIREADVIIGTDGAGSSIRRSYESGIDNFECDQSFLEYGYKELSISAGVGQNLFKLKKNGLHIWPRGGFMLIALPNFDGSFTLTLFLAFKGQYSFEHLESKEAIDSFFETHFPDVVQYMSELSEEFMHNPTGKLGTVRCFPWQVYHKFLLLGDAAHAIVPFYGQGMNSSFEDCLILDRILEDTNESWVDAMDIFQKTRKKDADAIADLAIDNFYEMRDHVADENYVKRRLLEIKLEANYPDYNSKYSLVTFQNEVPYSMAQKRGKMQNEILLNISQRVNDIEELDIEDVYRRLKSITI